MWMWHQVLCQAPGQGQGMRLPPPKACALCLEILGGTYSSTPRTPRTPDCPGAASYVGAQPSVSSSHTPGSLTPTTTRQQRLPRSGYPDLGLGYRIKLRDSELTRRGAKGSGNSLLFPHWGPELPLRWKPCLRH